ncbi:DUF1272 domain-containing protein [Haloarchaeobius sp. TZWWS8]|uniref:DUF1272 domain-containing protein n=1 Tax=Haloarchaeobius sp. TZWWS8 TaxID=3446121 RepID=UPI003EBD127A
MSVINTIKNAIGAGTKESTAIYECGFCEEQYETAYSICPGCGGEDIARIE